MNLTIFAVTAGGAFLLWVVAFEMGYRMATKFQKTIARMSANSAIRRIESGQDPKTAILESFDNDEKAT